MFVLFFNFKKYLLMSWLLFKNTWLSLLWYICVPCEVLPPFITVCYRLSGFRSLKKEISRTILLTHVGSHTRQDTLAAVPGMRGIVSPLRRKKEKAGDAGKKPRNKPCLGRSFVIQVNYKKTSGKR
ncbi:hypothetical protein KIL84_006396 [Mauremys mutica]|uniref:Uncharacterized protein n=1 Tax=Mauremys mutica TaxID=74926 RepID=A0A9D3X1D7_9SAUR|nr:hypothetical protein KIL84_006396 [Mauremys mutica]